MLLSGLILLQHKSGQLGPENNIKAFGCATPFQKMCWTPFLLCFMTTGGFNKANLAQITSLKLAKLGPDNNFTAHTYIYIYIYTYTYIHTRCRVKNWSKFCLFSSQNWSKFSLVFPLCFLLSSPFCRENELLFFSKKGPKKGQKRPFSWVKDWSNYVAQHTGPIFDSTLEQVLTQDIWHFWAIFVFQTMLKPQFL